MPELLNNLAAQVRYLNLEYFYVQSVALYERISSVAGPFLSGNTPFYIAYTLSALFFIGIAYSLTHFVILMHEEKKRYGVVPDAPIPSETEKNERWETVLHHRDSDNLSDWKLAIIDADTILDELVERMGYQGENLGERLKMVEPSDFLTLQDAWDAHKVRNQIAHEGSAFNLNKREVIRIIQLYENIFKEFKYI
jgi:hypothetical protein